MSTRVRDRAVPLVDTSDGRPAILAAQAFSERMLDLIAREREHLREGQTSTDLSRAAEVLRAAESRGESVDALWVSYDKVLDRYLSERRA